MKGSFSKSIILVASLMFPLGSAWAELMVPERNMLEIGNTIISWDSSFTDLNYTTGNYIGLVVSWEVLSGTAEFEGLNLKTKGFSPGNVEGKFMFTTVNVDDPPIAGSAEGVLVFTQLKTIGGGGEKPGKPTQEVTESEKSKGTAQLHLIMSVDTDSDGNTDLDVALGVTVHVCDNGDDMVPCPAE